MAPLPFFLPGRGHGLFAAPYGCIGDAGINLRSRPDGRLLVLLGGGTTHGSFPTTRSLHAVQEGDDLGAVAGGVGPPQNMRIIPLQDIGLSHSEIPGSRVICT